MPKSCSSVFCSPRLPLTTTTFSIFAWRHIFHRHFPSLIDDDDRALRDLSVDSTMTSPLLCDHHPAYLAVSWLELLCDLFLRVVQSQAIEEDDTLGTRLFRYRCCAAAVACIVLTKIHGAPVPTSWTDRGPIYTLKQTHNVHLLATFRLHGFILSSLSSENPKFYRIFNSAILRWRHLAA